MLTGSQKFTLMKSAAESLAGRIAFHELPALSLDEVGARALDRRWLRGGFPRAFTARSLADSAEWRRAFVRTFLERDVLQFGINIPAPTLERFWAMLAHHHGQIWNASEFARAFGVSYHAVQRYLAALEATFMVRVLRPWADVAPDLGTAMAPVEPYTAPPSPSASIEPPPAPLRGWAPTARNL